MPRRAAPELWMARVPRMGQGPSGRRGRFVMLARGACLGQVDPRAGIGPKWGLNTVCWNQEEHEGPAS